MRKLTTKEAKSFQEACFNILVAGKVKENVNRLCYELAKYQGQLMAYVIVAALLGDDLNYIDEPLEGTNSDMLGPIRQTFLMFIVEMSPQNLIDMVGETD